MSLANTYFDSSSSPHKYYQVSYKQTARDGSSATYQVSINARLRYSTSYFNYPLYADVTINGTTARITLNSGSWSGDAWKGAKTVTIKASAGTSGGTLSASIKFTSTSGYSWSITGKTVSLSTWNTAPTWASNDANINGWKQDKIIPENTGSVTIDAPALNDKEQTTMYYDIYRYVNGQQDKTIVRGATKTKGNRYTTTDDISSLGQGAVIKYLIQGHDGVPAWAGDRWTYVYTKNKLTPASATVSGAIGYSTANFVVTLSGALNSDGTTGLKYNLSSPQLTIYNATNLTTSPTITIFKSGTAPTTPYIRFDDLKSLTINNNWQGSFVINVETVNARGTKASKSVTVSVDLRTNPTSATFKAHGGLVTIGNASYYLPSHKDIVISWNAGSDPLGKAVTYDLQVKKGTGGYETIATGLTATSYTYKTSAVTAKTAFVFKVITRTTFNYTATKESDVIYAHYYNTPTVSFGTPTRATNEFSIAVTTATRSSMENVAISSRRYKGKSGSWITFAGSPYTLRETGLTESQAYTITIEITDNSGLTGATQTFTDNVSAYIPILSIRKKGVGVNSIPDGSSKFKVKGGADLDFIASKNGAGNYFSVANGGRYRGNGSKTGYLKITLPVKFNNTMIRFDIDVYNYVTNSSATYTVGGYAYNGTTKTWGNNPFGYCVGHRLCKFKNLKIRLGEEGGFPVVYIGEADTVWNHPQVTIKNITLGYTGAESTEWYNPWSISFETTVSNITATIPNPWVVDVTTDDVSEAATANKIVKRDGAGDINCRLLRPNYQNQNTISGALAYRVNNSSDNYVRFCSDTTAIKKWLGVSSGRIFTHHGNVKTATITFDKTKMVNGVRVSFITSNKQGTDSWHYALNGKWVDGWTSNGPTKLSFEITKLNSAGTLWFVEVWIANKYRETIGGRRYDGSGATHSGELNTIMAYLDHASNVLENLTSIVEYF